VEAAGEQAAGNAPLKAFASYRSAWQFTAQGEQFKSLYEKRTKAFDMAITEPELPASFFTRHIRVNRFQACSSRMPTMPHSL
jgi:hypothetical protein